MWTDINYTKHKKMVTAAFRIKIFPQKYEVNWDSPFTSKVLSERMIINCHYYEKSIKR